MSNSSKRKRPSNHRSIVWKFYVYPTDGSSNVPCPKCPNTILTFNGSTTTNILYHLQSQHEDSYARLRGESIAESAGSSGNTQEEAEYQLAKSFVTGLVPFRFSQNMEFRKFLDLKPENFHPPSGAKIRKLIGKMAETHTNNLFDSLKGTKKYTFLTDGYSDLRGNYHFYSLHVIATDADFNRKIQFCNISPVGRGDAVTVSSTINKSLNAVGLKFSQCSSMVSDSGSELVLTAQLQQLDRVHCGCHLLNLIISDFSKEKKVNYIYCRVQAFARHLAKHKTIRDKLRSLASAKGSSIKIPLPLPVTRWSALPLMLEGYLSTYEYALDLADLKEFLIKPNHLEKIRLLSKCLHPIHQGILRLEREKSFASEIVPALFFIKEQLKTDDDPITKKLFQFTTRRLSDSLKNNRLICTMLVDHRFGFSSIFSEIIDWAEVEKLITAYEDKDIDGSAQAPANSSNSSQTLDLDSFLDGTACSSAPVSKNLKAELNQFRVLLETSRPTFPCPLQFWKGQKSNFPLLASIARELLTTPASSAAAERTFSRCTDLLRQKKRNRATVDTIDDLLSVAELIKIERAKNEAEAFFEEDEEEFLQDEETDEYSEKADLDDWMDDEELQDFGTEEI